MYHHADQSWKDKPMVLSDKHEGLLVLRLKEYALEKKLEKLLVIYHGGEPLIFGIDRLINLSDNIKSNLEEVGCNPDFGIQTNGVLLTEEMLKKLENKNISISLSIDGPKEIHDEHRLDHRSEGSFDRVYKALNLLKQYPKIFTGCIGVINPNFEPKILFDFFHQNNIKEFNILLPDANYVTPPKWREKNPNLYKDWLIKAFDCWSNDYPHIHCKFFESIFMAILGQGGQCDSLGLGDVNLLNIETDGTYHDLDVLKITEENYSYLGKNLENNKISEIEDHPKINLHRSLLSKEGLSKKCLACKHLDLCGGGSVPHRFDKNGSNNPTIYCEEMYSLIDHMLDRFSALIRKESQHQDKEVIEDYDENSMALYWNSKTSIDCLGKLKNHSAQKNYSKLKSCLTYAFKVFPKYQDIIGELQKLSFDQLKYVLLYPPVVSWLRAFYGQSINSLFSNVKGDLLTADPDYLKVLLKLSNENQPPKDFVIQKCDDWYKRSLGENIIFDHSKEKLEKGLENLRKALEIIKNYNLSLYNEILFVSPYIEIIKDLDAEEDKDVSFSLETLPGALFIDVWQGFKLLNSHTVAASIIHEHLHQKLYLLQQRFDMFLDQDTMIYSPWPKLYRPPVGALHAVYVFTHVASFWNALLKQNIDTRIAEYELEITLERLDQCIGDIDKNVSFTKTGRLFFNCLLKEYNSLLEQSVLQNA